MASLPREDNRMVAIGIVSSLSSTIIHPATYTPIAGVDPLNVAIVDASGSQITSFGASTVDGATFTQNSSTGGVSMGVYVASPQTLTTGKSGAIALDINRNTMVTEATLLAGENLTTNRLNNEPVYSYLYVASAATTTVKSGAGTFHTLVVQGGTTGTIIIYDNTTNSGTIIASFDTTVALATYTFDVSFATGLTIVSAANTKYTVTYR